MCVGVRVKDREVRGREGMREGAKEGERLRQGSTQQHVMTKFTAYLVYSILSLQHT